jgi:hypothetical protein
MRYLSLLLVVAALVGAAPRSHAQSDGRKNYYALIIGPGLPIGGYASSGTDSPGAGPARSGYLDTFANYARRTGPRGGWAASLAYGEFEMDAPNDDDWWQVTVLTAGPMYVQPLARKLDLELKLKLGMMATVEIIDSFESQKGVGFAIDARSGLRYDAFRRWSALAEIGLVTSGQRLDLGGNKGVHAMVSGIGVAFRW